MCFFLLSTNPSTIVCTLILVEDLAKVPKPTFSLSLAASISELYELSKEAASGVSSARRWRSEVKLWPWVSLTFYGIGFKKSQHLSFYTRTMAETVVYLIGTYYFFLWVTETHGWLGRKFWLHYTKGRGAVIAGSTSFCCRSTQSQTPNNISLYYSFTLWKLGSHDDRDVWRS